MQSRRGGRLGGKQWVSVVTGTREKVTEVNSEAREVRTWIDLVTSAKNSKRLGRRKKRLPKEKEAITEV